MNANKHLYVVAVLIVAALIGNSYMQYRMSTAKAETTSQMANDLRKQWQDDLKTALSSIQKDRDTVKTPAQVAVTVPKYTPDVKPLVIVTNPVPTSDQSVAGQIPSVSLPDAPSAIVGGLVIPKDQVPAYWDSVTTCAENTLKLGACQKELPLAEKERDQWKKAAKGSFWGNLRRNGKWFVIGGLAGAAGALAATH